MFKRLTLSALTLIACVTFSYKAHAMPTLWEIQLNETYFFNTRFVQPAPGSLDIQLRQGAMDVTSTFRFLVGDPLAGIDTPITTTPQTLQLIYNTQYPGSLNQALCILNDCFITFAANLFLVDSAPHIQGVVYNPSPCCSFNTEVSFDGWYSELPAGYWESPLLPTIPTEFRDVTPGEFVRRIDDPGFRGLEFGTYNIRQVPEPSTLILFGVGLVALVVRFRKKFTR